MTAVRGADGLVRCPWPGEDPLYLRYHDQEWGRPLRDDRALFELLLLEGAQAGLSWITILRKRERYRQVFEGFDPERIAGWDEEKIGAALADPGIVRNRLKVRAFVRNARAYLDLVETEGSFSRWLWAFVGNTPIVNRPASLADAPTESPESRAMSRELRRRGFTFVGPTICYAFMQAAGLVDDHLEGCFRAESRPEP